MKKLRSDAVIGKLTPPQREILDGWIFVDNLSYREAASRVREQFQVYVYPFQVKSYHEREYARFLRQKIMASSNDANELVRKLISDPNDYQKALLKMLGQVVFELALSSRKPEILKEVRDSLRVLTAAKQEEHQADRVALHREKWEFDVSRMCVAHLAELQAIIADHSLDEPARLQAIRRRLFGERPAS